MGRDSPSPRVRCIINFIFFLFMAKKSDLKSLEDLISTYGETRPDEYVSTGVDCLDDLWGGGLYLGYMASLWGERGAGKSTLAAQICRSFCRQGKKVVYLDSERALNSVQRKAFGLEDYASSGVFIHLVVRNYLELEQQAKVISDSDVSLVVIDSVSQIEAWADKEVTLADAQIGVKARQQGFVLPRIKSWFADAGIASILLFHARANFNTGGAWGAPTTKQDGGFVAQHVPDIITKLGVGGLVKDKLQDGSEVPIGANLFIECEKNKFGATRLKIQEKLIYGLGISRRISVIDKAVSTGVIRRSGASYSLPWGEKYVGMSKLYEMPKDSVTRLRDFMRSAGESESHMDSTVILESESLQGLHNAPLGDSGFEVESVSQGSSLGSPDGV